MTVFDAIVHPQGVYKPLMAVLGICLIFASGKARGIGRMAVLGFLGGILIGIAL